MADWIPSKSPGFIGAAIGMLVGVGFFGYGLWSFFAPTPTPLPQSFALVIVGFGNWVVCFFAMKRSRLAWSFAQSINGTGVLVFLFGAPKVRDAFDTNMALGLAPAMLLLVVTMLLAVSGDEYD